MVGEEHTIVGPCVQATFESPEDVHLLDRREIRWSQIVHGERAQCELHDSGPVRMSTSGRIRVPANSLPRVKRRTKRPGLVCGSTRRGRREHQRRFQVVVVGELGVVGELAVGGSEEETWRPRAMCCRSGRVPRWRPDDEDWEHLLFVDGATRLTGPNPVSHPPHVPPFDRQREGSSGGGRTRGTRRARPRPGATQVVPRTAKDIPDPSCARAQRRQRSVKAHRKTGGQTTERGTTMASS